MRFQILPIGTKVQTLTDDTLDGRIGRITEVNEHEHGSKNMVYLVELEPRNPSHFHTLPKESTWFREYEVMKVRD
jgi:hypothetical protein